MDRIVEWVSEWMAVGGRMIERWVDKQNTLLRTLVKVYHKSV